MTGACVLRSVILAAGAGGAEVDIHDGTGIGGVKRLTLAAPAGDSRDSGSVDLAFSSGIYINLTGICAVTVVWG